VWGRAMQVSIYRLSETKNDTAERNTARKNVQQRKNREHKRETTLTHYRYSKRQTKRERQPKKDK